MSPPPCPAPAQKKTLFEDRNVTASAEVDAGNAPLKVKGGKAQRQNIRTRVTKRILCVTTESEVK